MFQGLSVEQSGRLKRKLKGVSREDLVWITDYHLTLAPKANPKNYDDTHLKARHYRFLYEFAPSIGHVVVLSGGSQKSLLGDLQRPDCVKKFGLIRNLSLGACSGHIWRMNIADPNSASEYISIPTYADKPQLKKACMDGISSILSALENEYCGRGDCLSIITEMRDIGCGAAVVQMEGAERSGVVQDFYERVRLLRNGLGKPVSSRIHYSGKSNQVAVDGRVQTQFYIDFKLDGVTKGYTARKLLTEYGIINKNSVIVVSGDSRNSDYPMMWTATKLVKEGAARAAVCIDVGGNIRDVRGIVDVILKKDFPHKYAEIDRLYGLLGDIGAYCDAGEKAFVPDGIRNFQTSGVRDATSLAYSGPHL